MRIITPIKIKEITSEWRSQELSIGFVPTMGALHQGHLSLLQKAKQENDKVVVSIFVNPLQFNDANDFKKYPRNIASDTNLLENHGCDLIMHGELADFFDGQNDISQIELLEPGVIASELEGEKRPGHFAGVKTIVAKLFSYIGECRAYFGEKDYQQSKIIEQLSQQLGYPDIIVCPIVRDENGLALSSRNSRLSDKERALASKIYKAMNEAKLMREKMAVEDKIINFRALIDLMHKRLDDPNIEIDYIALKDNKDWHVDLSVQDSLTNHQQLRALVAIYIRDIRLIDTMLI